MHPGQSYSSIISNYSPFRFKNVPIWVCFLSPVGSFHVSPFFFYGKTGLRLAQASMES